MSWTAPRTWVTAEVPTSSNMNAHVRDNLNALIWTEANTVASSTTTSASYANLADGVSTSVTITTAAKAAVFVACQGSASVAGTTFRVAYAVSGATTLAANDSWCVGYTVASASALLSGGRMSQQTALTSGSNTFTIQYKRPGGTGTLTILRRRIMVLAVA